MKVEFTQFYFPHGQQRPEWIELPDRLAAHVAAVRAAGCRLTAECFPDTQLCSFCIEEPEYGDFDQELCFNGPQVPIRITAMLERFNPERFKKWRAEMAADDQQEDTA